MLYKVNIPDVASATLSYTNKKVKSDNARNPYYITVADPVIEDHQFTVLQTGYQLLFEVTLSFVSNAMS